MFEFKLFRQFPVRWVLWWIIMPNIGALLLLPIGGPNIAWPMTICGVLSLLVSRLPGLGLRRIGLMAIFVLSAIFYVALSFNIDAEKAFTSLQYLTELSPLQSPEYLVAALVLLGALVATLRYGPQVGTPRGWRQLLLALTGLALVINVDSAATAGLCGSYKMVAPSDASFSSAARQARFTPETEKGQNVLVVIVESMGLPTAPDDRKLFDRIWNKETWSDRYDVSEGSTPYYGSTTTGEMRELCGFWGDYTQLAGRQAPCLPQRFKAAGYATTAIHSFESTIFDRWHWYPRIGFDQQLFKDDLLSRKAHPCQGIFAGVCDRDVPRIIGDHLRAHTDQPQFVYWLTVNAHLPIPRNGQLDTEDCTLGTPTSFETFPCYAAATNCTSRWPTPLPGRSCAPIFQTPTSSSSATTCRPISNAPCESASMLDGCHGSCCAGTTISSNR